MGRIIGLHARFSGPHYEQQGLHFGPQWSAHHTPEDALEFSEYGRDHHARHAAWLGAFVLVGSGLIWLSLFTLL